MPMHADERIRVDQESLTGRYANGNTDDFLAVFKNYACIKTIDVKAWKNVK